MKKPKKISSAPFNGEELRPEYNFDYRKAKPNRFTGRSEEDRLVVVLDSDVSRVFRTPDSVNAVLRALIETMPLKAKKKTASG